MLAAVRQSAAEIILFSGKRHIIAVCMQHIPTAAANKS